MNHAQELIPSPLDNAFAAFIRRMATENASLAGRTAALVSCRRRSGDACICMADWEKIPPTGLYDNVFPTLEEWKNKLIQSGLFGEYHENKLFVITRDNRLYMRRYYEAELQIAQFIQKKLTQQNHSRLEPQTKELFSSIFPTNNTQAQAAASALFGKFSVITGGPGTGKTTVISKIINLLNSSSPGSRIALAAPTGKAAARINDSVAKALGDNIPKASTIHRLLDYNASIDVFRHNMDNPLPYDTIIIDEAGMVDLLLMRALVSAIAPSCRLILAGDSAQLASVETGSVLADVCKAKYPDARSSEFRTLYEELSGTKINAGISKNILDDAVTVLDTNYRFNSHPGISSLATAIVSGDGEGTIHILEKKDEETALITRPDEESIRQHVCTIYKCKDAKSALDELGKFKILCALRKGETGTEAMNLLAESILQRETGCSTHGFYHGRPVMITANAHNMRLYNGDIGVCLHDEKGTRVWFTGDGGALRDFSPERIPAHETAWAVTIHKSQGSEYNRVLISLPGADNPLLTRELLYTGITRTKEYAAVYADQAAIKAAVSQKTIRHSGLLRLLSDKPE